MIDKILDFHPSKKYPGMTIYDYLSEFWDKITFSKLRFDIYMNWCKKYGKKQSVYSKVFKKYGKLLENGWFVPLDGSFSHGYDPNLQNLLKNFQKKT